MKRLGLVGTAYKADEEDDLENADVTPRQNEESDDALSTSVAEEDENAMSADHRIFEGDMVEVNIAFVLSIERSGNGDNATSSFS